MQKSTLKTAVPDANENAPDRDVLWYAEALFFAYREFTGEPDRILTDLEFGRAHHRVLFFVSRYPALRVADLLGILQITKQSLSRVLRELIKEGYVRQEAGPSDRRERLLFVTEKGAVLVERLAALQIARIEDGLKAAGVEGRAAVARFLDAMIGNSRYLPHNRGDQSVIDSDTPIEEK
ncbi:MAG: MarR family transcriptional regulator [Hyphomicrobiales bacterium]|nr:MarR family transcriptional regulator [Hyphomicrobiales bacterium]